MHQSYSGIQVFELSYWFFRKWRIWCWRWRLRILETGVFSLFVHFCSFFAICPYAICKLKLFHLLPVQVCEDVNECEDGKNGGCVDYSHCTNTLVCYIHVYVTFFNCTSCMFSLFILQLYLVQVFIVRVHWHWYYLFTSNQPPGYFFMCSYSHVHHTGYCCVGIRVYFHATADILYVIFW